MLSTTEYPDRNPAWASSSLLFSSAYLYNRLFKIIENSLYIVFINAIPRKLLGSDTEPFLYMGQIILRPHAGGKLPELKMLLKRSFNTGCINIEFCTNTVRARTFSEFKLFDAR